MKVSDIKNLIKQELQTGLGTTIKVSDTEILAMINDGYKDIVAKTMSNEVIDSITTISGVDKYSWDGDKVTKIAFSAGALATGGTITYTDSSGLNPRSSQPYDAGYVVHTFTSSGTFTLSKVVNCDYLIVGGGGAGGAAWASGLWEGGGGGAGGVLTGMVNSLALGTYPIVVGDGGSFGDEQGHDSSFNSLTAYGGGRGGSYLANGANGGSGGGCAYSTGHGHGVAGQGHDGFGMIDIQNRGCGGGGASEDGGGDQSIGEAAHGGDGVSSSLSGTPTYYGGGGGGFGYDGWTYYQGVGGQGGGGNSAAVGSASPGYPGTANTGGGGGGAFSSTPVVKIGGNGGSGIVIIRYLCVFDTYGLLKINPQIRGRVSIDDNKPKCWFPWGSKIVIEPVPDDAYPLDLYVSDYPTTELTSDTDIPSCLPLEFHECIIPFSCYCVLFRMKKWGLASYYYNRYLNSVETRYKIYMDRKAEDKKLKRMPDRVRRNR